MITSSVGQVLKDVLACLDVSPEWQYLKKCMGGANDDLGDVDFPSASVAKHTQAAGAVERYSQRLSDEAVAIATKAINGGGRMSWAEAERQAIAKLGQAPRSSAPAGPSRAEKYSQRLADTAVKIHAIAANRGMQLNFSTCSAVAERLLGPAPPRPQPERYTESRESRDAARLADRAVDIATIAADEGRRISYREAVEQARRQLSAA